MSAIEEKENCAVKIAVRERPMRDCTAEAPSVISYPTKSTNVLLVDERPFAFDFVLGPTVSQRQIFGDLIKPIVEKAKQGFNCTVMAYGQTSTGKTYSMGLDSYNFEGEHVGLIPRCLKEVIDGSEDVKMSEMPKKDQNVCVSFIEIYNEKVYDLLAENSTEPIIARGFRYTGGVRKPIATINDCYNTLIQGCKNRHVRPTKINTQSSRSHAIFTIHISRESNGQTVSSCLNLVDLAGSEGVRRTGHQGMAMSEGVNINQGLLCIAKVLQAMAMGNKVIPYRDSVLTSVLQDSLSVNSCLVLLACISPYREDLSETLSTLRFAQSAKHVKLTPQVNAVLAEIKRNKSKTPYKILPIPNTKTPSSLHNKNPYSRNTLTMRGLVKSNTFSTPDKSKCPVGNKFNQTDTGLTSTGNQKSLQRSSSNEIVPSAVSYQNHQESFLNGTLDSRVSLMSNISTSTVAEKSNGQVNNFSPIVRKIENVEKQMLELMKTIEGSKKENPRSITDLCASTPFLLRQELKNAVREILFNNDTLDKSKTSPKNTKCKLFTTSSPVFKVPEVPNGKRSDHLPLDMSIEVELDSLSESTFENETTLRRSQRIEKRKSNNTNLRDQFIMNDTIRRSRRISAMMNDTQRNNNNVSLMSMTTTTTTKTSHNTHMQKNNSGKCLKKIHEERRHSIRLAAHKEEPKLNKSVSKKSVKSSKVKGVPKNSVIESYFKDDSQTMNAKKINRTKHRQAILELLNLGSMKELQLLPQVGLKTAYQIVSHRTLNGKFKNFSQVEKLPIWRGKAWERFAQANMLL